MKVNEIKEVIEKYSDKELRTIILELYKSIPKKVKEEKGIDEIIRDPNSLNKIKKSKDDEIVDGVDLFILQTDVEEFIENAKAQYYCIPNRVVSKKERPKWRFLVKRFYKDLIALSKVDLAIVSELLEKLYNLLCYSCGYVLFTAYDPFESIGITQEDFFRSVLSLKFQNEKTRDFIHNAILLIINNHLNRYTLHSTLMEVLLEFLKTADMKDIAIEECNKIIEEIKSELKPISKKSRVFVVTREDSEQYRKREKIQNLAELGFLLYAGLSEYDNAIEYFKKNYIEREAEVSLYVLLRLLFNLRLKDYWIREYEIAVKNGINPRDNLVQMYKAIKETGKLPEYMF